MGTNKLLEYSISVQINSVVDVKIGKLDWEQNDHRSSLMELVRRSVPPNKYKQFVVSENTAACSVREPGVAVFVW